MSEIIVKPNILGYYYINASKKDKQMAIYFQVTETEAYLFNIVFPKCRVSYIFLFRNPQDNAMYLSTKAAKNLTDAMDQTNFSIRQPILAVIVGDQERRTINFITEDASDQNTSLDLFDSSCRDTEFGRYVQSVVRQGVIDGNAGIDLTLWFVDGLRVGGVTMSIDCSTNSGTFIFSNFVINRNKSLLIPRNDVIKFCSDQITVTDQEQIIKALIFKLDPVFAKGNYGTFILPPFSKTANRIIFETISA